MDNEENKNNIPQPLAKKKMSRKERRHTDFPHDPVKGRALHKWSTFFFVLTIIGTVLAGITLVLPIFLVIVGLISALAWVVVIAFVSIFTLFMIWTSEDAKSFFNGWRVFNEKLLDSSNNAQGFAQSVIPAMLISGGAIILITWLFLIIGRCTDAERKKKYVGKIIALSIITVIYIVFLIFNLI